MTADPAADLALLLFAVESVVRVVEEPPLRPTHATADASCTRVGRFVPGAGRAARVGVR